MPRPTHATRITGYFVHTGNEWANAAKIRKALNIGAAHAKEHLQKLVDSGTLTVKGVKSAAVYRLTKDAHTRNIKVFEGNPVGLPQ